MGFVGSFGLVQRRHASGQEICQSRKVYTVGMVAVSTREWRRSEIEAPDRQKCLKYETTVISWSDVHGLVDVLCEKMKGRQYDLILAVARGGVIPATLLSARLGVSPSMDSAFSMFHTSLSRTNIVLNGAPI